MIDTPDTECNHPHHRHTVMYSFAPMENDPFAGIPFCKTWDTREDAMALVERLLDQEEDGETLRLIKVYRSDNENYCCYLWTNFPPVVPLIAVEPLRRKTLKERFTSLFGPYRVDDW